MIDNEFILYDRIEAIKTTILKYGEDKFYLSFSGGKDSTILHHLLDIALPDNKIPRVFSNTGIEYTDIVDFVSCISKDDDRFVIISPKTNIKEMLEKDGYPFKSKQHSEYLSRYKSGHIDKPTRIYFGLEEKKSKYICPKSLMYQKENNFKINISSKCCKNLKKIPMNSWAKENKKQIAITGMRNDEGGARENIGCFTTVGGKVKKFHPLIKVDDSWEEWFIDKYNIQLCKLYYPPYNFERTGCKGCPYSLHLQEQLDVMEKLLPNERKQCEIIWKPIYDEYRRINYRLESHKKNKLF